MKDENVSVLLEGLATDVATILKKLNSQNSKTENLDGTNLSSEIKLLMADFQTIQAGLDLINTSHAPIGQQRIIDLKIQLDRIALKMHKEDNFFMYYFSPPKILVTTIFIIVFSVLAGVAADRLYIKHKNDQTLNAPPDGNN